jgi:two-component system cell cycle sensor histidine kinase/response regulator CckA
MSILIVDDDPSIRTFARRTLEQAGYSVCEARNGRDAIDQAAHMGHVDLFITDICMPETDGAELTRKLRRFNANTAIIAISGAFEGELLNVADLLGVKAVLQKPFTAEELLKAVRSATQPNRKAPAPNY